MSRTETGTVASSHKAAAAAVALAVPARQAPTAPADLNQAAAAHRHSTLPGRQLLAATLLRVPLGPGAVTGILNARVVGDAALARLFRAANLTEAATDVLLAQRSARLRSAGLAHTRDQGALEKAATSRQALLAAAAAGNPATDPGRLAALTRHDSSSVQTATVTNAATPTDAVAAFVTGRGGGSGVWLRGRPPGGQSTAGTRYAGARAALFAHPGLAGQLAGDDDASVRRAVAAMPYLTANDWATVARRGLRSAAAATAAANPSVGSVGDTVACQQARARLDDLGTDPATAALSSPDARTRWQIIGVGSPTLDLLLACNPHLQGDEAVAMVTASGRDPVDSFVMGLLVERFGLPVYAATFAQATTRSLIAQAHSALISAADAVPGVRWNPGHLRVAGLVDANVRDCKTLELVAAACAHALGDEPARWASWCSLLSGTAEVASPVETALALRDAL